MKHTQTVVKIFRSAIVYVQMELRQFRWEKALHKPLVKFYLFLMHWKKWLEFLS